MARVICSPGHNSSKNIQYCVNTIAKMGLGKNYNNELSYIAKTTVDVDVYKSTIYSLGLIKDKEAVKSILRFNHFPIEPRLL